MSARMLWCTSLFLLFICPSCSLPSAKTIVHVARAAPTGCGGQTRSMDLVDRHLRSRIERRHLSYGSFTRECARSLRGGGPVKATRTLLIKLPIFWLPWHRFPFLGRFFQPLEPEAPPLPPAPAPAPPSVRDMYFKVVETLTLLFPVWTVALQAIAFYHPDAFRWLSTTPISIGKRRLPVDLYSAFLIVIMFSMGTTLTFQDFSSIQNSAFPIGVAFTLQYGFTPLLAWIIGRFLSRPLAMGLMVLACSPGSQASNVASFIANCDLPVSILMTLVSTVASPLMTPLLLRLFLSTDAGGFFLFDSLAMAARVLKVTLAPILAGLLVNHYFPAATAQIKPVSPLLMVALTSCLCATPIASVASELKLSAVVPVVALQTLAFLGGYLIPRFGLELGERMSRTVAIETGMQSAALGYLLATQHFPSSPLVAVPSAFGILSMSLLGSALAVAWRLSG